MKRWLMLFGLGLVCLCLTACGKAPDPALPAKSNTPTVKATDARTPQSVEIVGPWHLDAACNDLAAFADSLTLFPGYGEFGASMEIRSNGQMSWYIGAEGWYGAYTVEGDKLHAQLTADSGQTTRLWELQLTAEDGVAMLAMPYGDMTITWRYGDREEGEEHAQE
ncbi:MAG: hypothetical protein PUC00_06155 [Clostridiales bacterium]|nr:hypothetical protein [Clostridiales bacterium]